MTQPMAAEEWRVPIVFEELDQLADDLIATGERLLEHIEDSPAYRDRQLTVREKVVAGLNLKMLRTFEALVEDARARRGEAMHHLKTLCEAFIYIHEAAASEERAELVLAYAYDERLRYRVSNRGAATEAQTCALREERDRLTKGRPLPRKVKRVAYRHSDLNLPSWYDTVYSLACEPAHISDLEDFFPRQDLRLASLPAGAGWMRAYIALRYAVELMINLVKFFNATTALELTADISEIESRYRSAAQKDPWGGADGHGG